MTRAYASPQWRTTGRRISSKSLINHCLLLVWLRKTDYNILDGDVEVPIKIRHDEKTNLTKIQIDDREQIIRG